MLGIEGRDSWSAETVIQQTGLVLLIDHPEGLNVLVINGHQFLREF